MKNQNKKWRFLNALLALAAVVLLLNSCKKDQTGNGGYVMKFDVNGTTVEFTGQASLSAAFSSSGNQYLGVFTGYDATSNMSLQIYDNKSIVAGSFSGYTIAGGALTGILITYQDHGGTVYNSATTNPDAVVNISEITSTTVRGTFSGTMKSAGKPDISVTNGQFFVWRAN